MFIERERERASMSGEGAERERERDKESQAGSAPPAQSPTWGSNPPTMRSFMT